MNIERTRSILLALGASVTTIAQAGPTPSPLDLDPAFAGDGTLILEYAESDIAATGLLEDSGEIVVFGESDDGSPSNREGIFQRVSSSGVPTTLERFPASDFGCTVPRTFRSGFRLSNGNYVAGGYVQSGCGGIPRWFNAFELTSDGLIIEEFDAAVFNNQLAYISALGEQSDGKIVAVGFASGSGSVNSTFDMAVTRYTTDGVLDTTFGTNGIFIFDVAGDQDWANDVAIDAEDRIVMAGYARSAGGDLDIAVLRLTPDGMLDPSFNGSGTLLYDRAGFDDTATEVELAPGGRILVGGYTRPSDALRDAAVLALTENGALDPAFGNGGIANIDFGTGDSSIAAMKYDAFRIYIAGAARPIGGDRVEIDGAVSVLRPNGTPHPLFNGGASRIFVFDPALGPQSDLPQFIDVSADGEQIVVTGFTDDEPRVRQRFAVARLIGLENAVFIDGFEETGG